MGQKSQQDSLFFRFFTKKLLLSCPYYVNKRPFSKKHTALLAIFCQKNFHALTNTVLSCHFFQIFHEEHPTVMPVFGQKNVNSAKTTLYYGPTKSIGCPFFPIFYEKLPALMTIFCQKNVHSLKNKLLSCLYFVKKSILSKTLRSHVIFFKFFMKNPLLLCPYLVKKTSILSKLNYIMGQKSQQDALFLRFFTKKSLLPCPYFIKNKYIL